MHPWAECVTVLMSKIDFLKRATEGETRGSSKENVRDEFLCKTKKILSKKLVLTVVEKPANYNWATFMSKPVQQYRKMVLQHWMKLQQHRLRKRKKKKDFNCSNGTVDTRWDSPSCKSLVKVTYTLTDKRPAGTSISFIHKSTYITSCPKEKHISEN